MELIFGADKIDRRVTDVEGLLRDWREKERDFGQLYLEHEPVTSHDRVVVEDLAVTMLINSRVDARQAMGVFRNGATLDLSVPVVDDPYVGTSSSCFAAGSGCSPAAASLTRSTTLPVFWPVST